jgi:hypothetical protein
VNPLSTSGGVRLITGSHETIGVVNARTSGDLATTSMPRTCSGKPSAATADCSADTAVCVRIIVTRDAPSDAKLTPIWFALLLTSSSANVS